MLPPRPPRLPPAVPLLALTAFFLRFGYAYGSGDQDELIPAVLHLLDGDLFGRDWLVQEVTAGVSVRTYFVWFVALPSLVMPVWLAAALLHVVTQVGVVYGVFSMAWALLRDRLGASAAAFAAVAVTPGMTIGGNAVVSAFLSPSSVASPFALLGLALFFQGRRVAPGLLLGLAACFHLLTGLQAALVLTLAALLGRLGRQELRGLAGFGTAFVAAALPVLVPVAMQQLHPAPAEPGAADPLYVHAFFRNPFHHLASTFPDHRHLRFWPLLATGVAGGVWLHRRGALCCGPFLARAGAVVAALWLTSVVFVEGVPVALVAKLQFFTLAVPVVLVATILACGALVRVLPIVARRFSERTLALLDTAGGTALAAAVAALVLVLAVQGVGRPGMLVEPLQHRQRALSEAEAWARTHTRQDALFAVPPSVSTFRTSAHRAIAANYAGFVFTDRGMQEWFQRLTDLAPLAPPADGIGIKPALDAAYHGHDPTDWYRLREEYGLDYALLERTAAELPFPVAFENAGWRVYRLGGGAL